MTTVKRKSMGRFVLRGQGQPPNRPIALFAGIGPHRPLTRLDAP